MPRSAWLLGSVIVGASLLTSPGGDFGLGLGPASAATRYYTRKKVNGRWVTGKFPGGSAAAKQVAASDKRGARRVRFVEKKGFAVKARYASLPRFKPKVVLRPAVAVTVDRKPADQAAKTASPADRVIATASISPAPPLHPAPEAMRPALEARARSLASELGIVSLPLPDAAPPVQLSARSITFDLEKGLRTIVFEDGATATAPFDKGRASDMTGLRAAR